MYDIVVVGGGVLGTCVSYWASALLEASVCVVEKEPDVAAHASGRNTGVVHTPYYMDPDARGQMARAALESRPMWEALARRHALPWREAGLLELALSEPEHKVLERHAAWAGRNGVPEGEVELIDGESVRRLEPGVRCHSALYCPREAAADYGRMTRAVRAESEALGTVFATGAGAVRASGQVCPGVSGRLVINCAGGGAHALARAEGLALDHTALHFRGEYWRADPGHADAALRTIYTVPASPEFPFLDPHWIRRADGSAEVGPNAVPVPGPETYEGCGPASECVSKALEVASGGARRLATDPAFWRMASREWLCSVSKRAMIHRVRRFLPAVSHGHFASRGTAGVRTQMVGPGGRLEGGPVIFEGEDSLHVLNYNSPGATGAPAYARDLVERALSSGLLQCRKRARPVPWVG